MTTANELEQTAGTALSVGATNGHEESQLETGSGYLTFTLADESYGIDILRVQEIKGWTPVTRVPNTPDYMQGVLNMRGTIVPIIDLRMRFGLETIEYTPTTVVIVLSVHSSDKERILGVVVDAVDDVINISEDNVKPTPDFGSSVNTEFLKGLGTVDDRMVMLLDTDQLMRVEELEQLDKSGT